jgi:DNA-directed RNA polymerase specialized sigma24 family protein
MNEARCLSGTSTIQAQPKNTDIEATLAQYDSYLIRQVRDLMRLHPDIIRREVLDLETDELVQRVRIKFWHALQDKQIEYPKTYIKRIVHSEFIDMVRRLKPHYMLELPVDEEGELYQGRMLITPSAGMADPSIEYEEQATASERLQEIVDAILALPARQQRALICDMRDRVDDLAALTRAFKERKANLESWQWPQQKNDKLLLRASLAYARTKVITSMKGSRQRQGFSTSYKKFRAVC